MRSDPHTVTTRADDYFFIFQLSGDLIGVKAAAMFYADNCGAFAQSPRTDDLVILAGEAVAKVVCQIGKMPLDILGSATV